MKQKKCAWSKCGKVFTPSPFRFNQRTCDNTVCAIGFVQDKEEKKKAQEWRKERTKMIEGLKSLTDLENEAKAEFQLFVRLRDKDLPCISCGKMNCKDWAGGHYFPAGQYSGMIFDEENCHKQCNTFCNCNLSGNLHEYRKGLIQRFGHLFVQKLEERAMLNRKRKYTRDELIELKLYYKAKIKELRKN